MTTLSRRRGELRWWIAVWLALTAGVGLADQPQWGERYTRNMVSNATGLPDVFDPVKGVNVRWVADLGTATYATPVIARGRVLIGTNNGNPRDPRHRGDRGVLLCLDEADGRLHWQLVVPKIPHDPYQDCPGVGITSTAVVHGDDVYVVSNRGEVFCLDLHGLGNGNGGPFREEHRLIALPGPDAQALGPLDADVIWRYDMRQEVGIHTHDSANVSVLLHGDFLYTSTPNGVDRTHRHLPSPHAPGLLVLDRFTGRLLAQDATGVGARIFHSTFSSPSMGVVNGRRLVFYGGADGVVYAFDALQKAPSPGQVEILREVWRLDCDPDGPKERISQYQGNRQTSPSSIIGMPVFYENRVFVTVGGDPWHGKREAWIQCLDATLSGDITGKGLIWSHPMAPHSTSTPAIQDGRVYITDFSGTIHCLDAATGILHWAHQVPGEIWGSPLLAEGKLYVTTRRGEMWVLAASSDLQVIHRVDFGEPLSTSPVAANGTLYVATPRRLYALAAP